MKGFLIAQLVAIPSTILGGFFAEKYGYWKTLFFCIGGWICVIISFATVGNENQFYLLAALTGLFIGLTPAMIRAIFGRETPQHLSGSWFGFNTLASRFSAFLGPLLFGTVHYLTGSYIASMLSLLGFLIVATFLLIPIAKERVGKTSC